MTVERIEGDTTEAWLGISLSRENAIELAKATVVGEAVAVGYYAALKRLIIDRLDEEATDLASALNELIEGMKLEAE